LAAAEQAHAPAAPSLSLLVGFLRLSGGDAAASAQQLLREAAPPLLAPYHAYYLGEALFYQRQYAAAAERFEAAANYGPASLQPRARARLGEALLASGDARGALLAIDEALKDTSSASLLWQRAQARELLGDAVAALEDLKRLAVEVPLHPYGAEAMRRLEQMRPSPLTFEDRLSRARELAEARPRDALEEIDQILVRKLARGRPAQAKVALAAAHALYGLGAVEEAEAQVEVARKGGPETAAEALLLGARRALKGDDNARTRALMQQVVAAGPRTTAGEEGGYYDGWLALRDDHFEEASKSFDAYLKRWPRSRRRDEVQWFRALALLRLGKYPEARAAALALASGSPRSQLVPQALYWAARASQLGGGAVNEVAVDFERVVDQFPSSFYALLARGRLQELGRPAAPGLPTLAALPAAATPPPPALEVTQALLRAGLLADAEQEAEAQAHAVRSADKALELGIALQRLGNYGVAYALANRCLWGAAFTDRKPEALALFYPRAFEPSVVAQAKAAGADPYLLWAVMRRESAFKPGEASGANARGLMQIIPPTAVQIARELSIRAPDADELYLPELNIQLAAWYLSALQKRFQHPALVAAAYNAGPTPVLQWARKRGDLPLDLFVETMAYRETRGYVRQVVADLITYHALYDAKPADGVELSLPRPLEVGVSF
ncbi:MAG TPA: transglycosylase SLT domain-containing protein, partial [Myxococcales bacterium]|nr:transglycosylase SLT domain-containing protein [Myxococcales bacterium]